MSDSPQCEREDCSKDSDLLLTIGERCWEHGFEDQPETAEYLATVGQSVQE